MLDGWNYHSEGLRPQRRSEGCKHLRVPEWWEAGQILLLTPLRTLSRASLWGECGLGEAKCRKLGTWWSPEPLFMLLLAQLRFGPTHLSAPPSPNVPHHTQGRNPRRLSHITVSDISRKARGLLKQPLISWASVCAQSCLTFCDPMDCRSPGSSVHGIL